ncbi:MAG: glycosyltransferase [Sphingomonadaceae bacterium]
MRVLSILHDRSPGGSERVALALAGEWRRQGLDSRLLLASEEGGAVLPAGVPVHLLESPRRRTLTSRFRMGGLLRAAVEDIRPDLVFLPGNWHFALARAIARAQPRPRIVAKLSNPPVPDLPPAVTPIGIGAFRALMAPVDCLVHWPMALAPRLRRLAPGLALAPIPNPPLTIVARQRQSHPPTRRSTVLVAGRLVAQKNVGLALDAFALAAAQRDLRLIIAGDGPERPALEARAAALGLAHRIRFIGHLPGLGAPMEGADVLLLTSRYEGTPAVVLEALASGVPVVATDCSPFLHDLLTTPARGRIVPRRAPDAVAAALLAQLAEPGTVDIPEEELAQFALPAVAAAYARLFQSMVAGACPEPSVPALRRAG